MGEILSQPAMMRQLAATHSQAVEQLRSQLPRPSCALIIARGTSDNAALYAKYLWGIRNRLTVALAAPSLYTAYDSPPQLPKGCLVVAISQSGESPDLVEAFVESGAPSQPRMAITNEGNSPLARAASVVADINAGVETAVAATKTYTAELMKVLQLSLAWDPEPYDIHKIASAMEGVLAESERIESAAAAFADSPGFAVLGRGFNLATAHECALKLTEIASVNARPFSTADFQHGPIAMVDRHDPVLAVAMSGAVDDDVIETVAKLRAQRSARLALVTNLYDATAEAVIRVPPIDEPSSPMVAIVAGQLFAYYLAKAKGLDPDAPRGLTKVTRTL